MAKGRWVQLVFGMFVFVLQPFSFPQKIDVKPYRAVYVLLDERGFMCVCLSPCVSRQRQKEHMAAAAKAVN